jgi:hypothetical protein
MSHVPYAIELGKVSAKLFELRLALPFIPLFYSYLFSP